MLGVFRLREIAINMSKLTKVASMYPVSKGSDLYDLGITFGFSQDTEVEKSRLSK